MKSICGSEPGEAKITSEKIGGPYTTVSSVGGLPYYFEEGKVHKKAN